MVAIIIGCTGLVGTILTRKVLADPQFTQVVAVTRKPLGIRNAKLKEITFRDLSELKGLREQLEGQVYFCCLGTTIKDAGSQDAFRRVDFKAVVEFGEIAEYHGAKALIVVSAKGAKAHAVNFYSHVKGEAELSLQNLRCRRVVILRPGLLIGDRRVKRPLEQFLIDAYRATESFLPRRFARTVATSAEAVAQRMLIEAKNDKAGTAIYEPIDI